MTHFCKASSLYLGCQAAMTSNLSGDCSRSISIKFKPLMALEGRKESESVVSRYMGTIEKHGAETTILHFKPNCLNQSLIEPLKFGREGEAIILGYSAISANVGLVLAIDEFGDATQT